MVPDRLSELLGEGGVMISWLHLLWIVPISVFLGFALAAVLTIGKEK